MCTRLIPVALAVLLLAGCVSEKPSSPSGSERSSPVATATPVRPQLDASGLSDALAADGLEVTASGLSTTGVFPGPAQYVPLEVSGLQLGIYTFPDPQQAASSATRVGPGGTSIAGGEFEWKGRPHFFQRDRLLVLYLSPQESSAETTLDSRILRVLRDQMGPQFAGAHYSGK